MSGVKVAPVVEFNTYDILRQKYLVLTRESLAVLKERAIRKADQTAAGSDNGAEG